VAGAVKCSGGPLVVFDSTLWHVAGPNRSDADRIPIDHQFTPYIEQQFDYARALGDVLAQRQSDRVQRPIGWCGRVLTSLEGCYATSGQRLPVRSGLSHGRSEARA
jgi:ectoine hydroxylase-related dioxygenase (phytanoyl-CoA dioxygenase family)